MKDKYIVAIVIYIIGVILGVVSMIWLANLTSWKITLAIFLMMGANNISQRKEPGRE